MKSAWLGPVALAPLLVSAAHPATVAGTVKGPDGTLFRGAFVQAQHAGTKMTTSVLSDRQGRYRFENLAAGTYLLRVRAVGYNADARNGLNLTAEQSVSHEFALKTGKVRWADLSQYQGTELFPDVLGNQVLKGKDVLVGRCFACHGFQSRMASVKHDANGWIDRVNYMRGTMHFFLDSAQPFTDQNAEDVATYINLLFGENPILPESPADIPAYKNLVRSFSDEAMKIVYVQYEMPNRNRFAWSAVPARDGTFVVPYYGTANRIARLNPATASVEEFRVPHLGTAAIHSAVPAPDGSIWLTQQGSNKLGRWDPQTKKIAEYQDSYLPGKEGVTAGGAKHTVRVDNQGRVWSTGTPLTVFDPKTGKYTHINDVPRVYGLALDKDGNCWFAENIQNGQIGKVDAKTLKVTKWSPTTTDGRPRRIQVATDGTIWFAEFRAGKIAQFDPKTEKFREYTLPGPEATPYALGVGRDGIVWYSSEDLDVIGALDPKSGKVTEYPIPFAENTMREFFMDDRGRMWFGSPANNTVGYFYLATGGRS
jgi:virginiamycin B lyase